MLDVLRNTEGGGGAGDGAAAVGKPDDTEFYKSEAQKAFKARDTAKAEMRALEDSGRVVTPERLAQIKALEDAAATAEEERKRKAGEFDSWRADFTKKSEAELSAEREKALRVTERLHTTLKDHAFAAASEWFGGSDSKTILTPAIASAYFGRFVAVEDRDGVECVIVKDPQGHAILDVKTGRPAAFHQAIGELIGMLPDKDSILRGSGKTGSGSSGGSGHNTQGVVDLNNLKPADFRDPKIREAVKRQQAQAGGLQMGTAFDRAASR